MLSTVRISTGPLGPVTLASTIRADPPMSAITSRLGPVVNPAGRPTKSPGVTGSPYDHCLYGTAAAPSPGYGYSVGLAGAARR